MPVPVKVRASFVSARLTKRKVGRNMDGETNGIQETTQGAVGPLLHVVRAHLTTFQN